MVLLFLLFSFISSRISNDGISFLLSLEGYNSSNYNESEGLNNFGIVFDASIELALGKKFKDIKMITKGEALNIFEYLIYHKYEKYVEKYNIIYHFNQNQYDALVSFAFNMGNIDDLTKNGTRTIEEISDSFLDFTYDKLNKQNLLIRRKLEKNLFDKPLNITIIAQGNYTYATTCWDRFTFCSSIYLQGNLIEDWNYINDIQDIGVIYYDPKTKKKIKTECHYVLHSIECSPYFPIEVGEYTIKLERIGIFDDGILINPFDLSGVKLFLKFNETTRNYEYDEYMDNVTIYKTFNYLPIFKEEYRYSSFLFGNFFFYRNYISLYNKTEKIKDKYEVEDVVLEYCEYDKEGKIFKFECNIIEKNNEIEYEGFYSGDHILICKGIINSNYLDLNYCDQGPILKYKIAETSIRNIYNYFAIDFLNIKKQNPRDIYEIFSFEYYYNENEGRNIFKFFGNSLNKKPIRNKGSDSDLYDFNIIFRGGYFRPWIGCGCFSYGENGTFIIKCYISESDNIIISSSFLADVFIIEENDEYDSILPFEFFFRQEIKEPKNFDEKMSDSENTNDENIDSTNIENENLDNSSDYSNCSVVVSYINDKINEETIEKYIYNHYSNKEADKKVNHFINKEDNFSITFFKKWPCTRILLEFGYFEINTSNFYKYLKPLYRIWLF